MNEHLRSVADPQASLVVEAIMAATNIECEQTVLGAIIVAPRLFQPIADILNPEDFSENLHCRIFECMADLAAQGKPISLLMLKAGIGDADLGGISLSQYLARCASEAPVMQGAIELARTVRDLAMRRRLVHISADAIQAAKAARMTVRTSELASQVVAALDEVASADDPATMKAISLADAGASVIAGVHAAKEGTGTHGLQTGLKTLDAMVGGLRAGEGSVLAARPSMGKSAVALEVSYNIAAAGKAVFYVSLEMGGAKLAERVMSSLCFSQFSRDPIPYTRIAKGLISDSEMGRLEDAAAHLRDVPFLIEQKPGLTVAQIAARVRRARLMFESAGRELELVVIDHLGLIAPSGRYRGDRVREIGEISTNLHAVARECGVHVMMLCQLSRAIESREDKRPQLHDLRESGEIEQNADLVMGLFREDYYLSRVEQTADVQSKRAEVGHLLEVGVLKNRQGPTGQVVLFADMASNAVRELR